MSVKYPAVGRNSHDLPRNKLSALLQCRFCRVLQSSAAWDLHPDNSHTLDVIFADNFGELLRIVNTVELRAADKGNMPSDKVLVKCRICV